MDSGFNVSKKKMLVYFFFSLVLHLAFLSTISNLKIHAPHLKKMPLKSIQIFETIQAQRQQSLNQTFNRFYPFFSKVHGRLKGPAMLEEGNLQVEAFEDIQGFSVGDDDFTLINEHSNAPDLLAASLPSDLPGVDQISLPRNVPIVLPLTLDEAQLKKEISEATSFLQKGLLSSMQDANQLLSSKILLAKMNEHLSPYHLDMQTLLPKDSSLFGQQNTLSPIELPQLVFSDRVPDLQNFLESEFEKLYTPSTTSYTLKDTSIISEAFSVEVKKTSVSKGKYVFFAVTLTPKSTFAFEKLNQDFIFLIDRSNSIEKQTFHTFKRSVSFALDILPKNERFNIAIFDSQAHLFANELQPIKKANILQAKTYLETRAHGGLFASTELFNVLSSFMKPSERITNVFLFSDGDTFLKNNQRVKNLLQCVSTNPRIHVHCIAAGDSNNLSILKLLSSLNRGQFIFESEVKKLQTAFLYGFTVLTSAIANELIPSVHPQNPLQKIAFFSPPHLMPMLYSKKPYTLYGVATSEDSFDLFLQGSSNKGVITIKKRIDLKTADEDRSLLPIIQKQKELMELETVLKQHINYPIKDILQ